MNPDHRDCRRVRLELWWSETTFSDALQLPTMHGIAIAAGNQFYRQEQTVGFRLRPPACKLPVLESAEQPR